MRLEYSSVVFLDKNNDIKQGRINYRPKPIKLRAFLDKLLCVVHYLKTYLQRTLDSRGVEKQVREKIVGLAELT